MATKKAKNGQNLEYIIIKPTSGFSAGQIADGILMEETDMDVIKKKYPTWNKLVSRFKDNLLEFGWSGLDYAWEKIEHYTNYDKAHSEMVEYVKKLNPELS